MSPYIEILLDALKDSAGVFVLALVIYIVFSFVEEKISHLLKKHQKASPAFGALAGLIPQCGVSVVAADLYLKEHISMGCLIAVFFACSDEALPILLFPQDGNYSKLLYLIPLLLIKLIVGFVIGFIVDLCIHKKEHKEDLQDEEEGDHVGCCHHHIEGEESKIKEHLVHPLLHSLKIFAYVFVVNLLFGYIIYWVGGESVFMNFLSTNKWLSPLFATLVGLIPNCASSVLVTELFLLDGIPFGALVSGLCVNAGLGLLFLLKNKKNIKNVLIILFVLVLSSLAVGYITMGIMCLF